MVPRAVRLVNALLNSRSDPPYLELRIGSPLDTGHVAPPEAEHHGPLPDGFGTAREDPFGALPAPRRGFVSAVLHRAPGRTREAGRWAFLHQEPTGPAVEWCQVVFKRRPLAETPKTSHTYLTLDESSTENTGGEEEKVRGALLHAPLHRLLGRLLVLVKPARPPRHFLEQLLQNHARVPRSPLSVRQEEIPSWASPAADVGLFKCGRQARVPKDFIHAQISVRFLSLPLDGKILVEDQLQFFWASRNVVTKSACPSVPVVRLADQGDGQLAFKNLFQEHSAVFILQHA